MKRVAVIISHVLYGNVKNTYEFNWSELIFNHVSTTIQDSYRRKSKDSDYTAVHSVYVQTCICQFPHLVLQASKRTLQVRCERIV